MGAKSAQGGLTTAASALLDIICMTHGATRVLTSAMIALHIRHAKLASTRM